MPFYIFYNCDINFYEINYVWYFLIHYCEHKFWKMGSPVQDEEKAEKPVEENEK